MAGLVPAIHEFFVQQEQRTWMAATSAAMTYGERAGLQQPAYCLDDAVLRGDDL